MLRESRYFLTGSQEKTSVGDICTEMSDRKEPEDFWAERMAKTQDQAWLFKHR